MTNNYGNYSSVVTKNNASLVVNNALMSTIDNSKKGALYIEYIKDVFFNQLKFKDKNILIIGAGGFTFSHESTFGNNITYLDIDSGIKNYVEKYFLHSNINGQFIADDARVYLNNTRKFYDLIFSDAYNSNNIPTSLLTAEYFLSVKHRVKQNGYAVFNIIADPFMQDPYSKSIDNTIKKVFRNCIKHPINYLSLANIIYICKKSSNENNYSFYTDNKNKASLDKFLT